MAVGLKVVGVVVTEVVADVVCDVVMDVVPVVVTVVVTEDVTVVVGVVISHPEKVPSTIDAIAALIWPSGAVQLLPDPMLT